jgi:hypothetical protein
MTCQLLSCHFANLRRAIRSAGIILLVLLGVHGITAPAHAVQETATPAAEDEDLMLRQWVKLNPTGSRAKFEMPVKPRFVERTFTPVRGKAPIKVRLHVGTAKKGAASFVVNYNDLHERPRGKKGISDTLSGAVQGSLVNVNGQLINEIQTIVLKNVPGRQFVYGFTDKNEKEYVVISRVFLKGRRLYQLSAVATRDVFDETVAGRFLNSFDMVRPKSDLPPVPKAP